MTFQITIIIIIIIIENEITSCCSDAQWVICV